MFNTGPTVSELQKPAATRRLAAVSFVDVVGYSALMSTDEARTHIRWMAIMADIIRPEAERHRGTVVKSTGDGVLAEFPSVLDAVQWAQRVQRSMVRAEEIHSGAGLPPIALRISVHLGDVVTADNDIHGDSVNVAARLQEFAEPGGVVISEAVHDLVRAALSGASRDLGLLSLKNMAKPIRAYALESETPVRSVRAAPRREPVPSIAVLPLQNMSGGAEDNYFADGIIEDIIVSLSNLRELAVIARGSTLAVGGRTDPREAGRALGARYVATGSIRRTPKFVRVSVQLYDADSGTSLWGYNTEAVLNEIFTVQDEIVERIVAGLAPQVRNAELRNAMRKRPDSFTAYDCTLRSVEIIDSLDRARFPQALVFLRRAMAEDPNFSMPAAWAARWHSLMVGQGWSDDPGLDAMAAVSHAGRAIELDRDNALALATFGHLRSYLFHDYENAMVYFERALSASPSCSLAWILAAGTLAYVGRGDEAVAHAERALRLSPFDPGLYAYYSFLGFAHYACGNYEHAAKWARMSMNENPHYTACFRMLAAALVSLGKLEEARLVGRSLLHLEPDFSVSKYEATRQPFRPRELSERFLAGLRSAGLPT